MPSNTILSALSPAFKPLSSGELFHSKQLIFNLGHSYIFTVFKDGNLTMQFPEKKLFDSIALLYFGLDDFSAIDADTNNKSLSPKLGRRKSLSS